MAASRSVSRLRTRAAGTDLAAADLHQAARASDMAPPALAPEPATDTVRTAAAPRNTAVGSSSTAAESVQADEEDTRPVYAAAVESLVTPQPVMKTAPALDTGTPFARPAPKAAVKAASKPVQASASTGRFVVQLGAFNSAASVERAWASAYKRYGFGGRTPLSTTVKVSGGTFHRLSVAGFESHGEAAGVCRSVRAKGGVCFVRAVAGDAPVRWAARYSNRSA
jgi:cell division septation protein DedD